MLPKAEARLRMCVLKVSEKANWTWRDWARWRFLWRFFPWYARNLRYRGSHCVADGCMHWHWENDATKHRGFCSVADSRTASAIWLDQRELPVMTGPDRPRSTV
jgi:hypothetical protein